MVRKIIMAAKTIIRRHLNVIALAILIATASFAWVESHHYQQQNNLATHELGEALRENHQLLQEIKNG